MERAAGPAIAFCLVIAMVACAYAVVLRGQLSDERAVAASIERKLEAANDQTTTFNQKITTNTAALDTCQSELKDAQNTIQQQETPPAADGRQTRRGGGHQ